MLRYCAVLLLNISNIVNIHLISSDQLKAVPELIVDKVSVTEPFTIGVKFTLEPGWYIYWENPGDGGIPPIFEWTLRDGFTVSDVHFPIPKKFYGMGALSYGYSDEVILITEVIPSTQKFYMQELEYEVYLSWMVCEDVCYLEEKKLSGTLDELPSYPDEIEIARAKLPKYIESIDISINDVTVSNINHNNLQVKIAFAGSDAHLVDDFFPLSIDNFVIHHTGITVSDNVITFSVSPYSRNAELTEINGLLITKDVGYKLSYPLPDK